MHGAIILYSYRIVGNVFIYPRRSYTRKQAKAVTKMCYLSFLIPSGVRL